MSSVYPINKGVERPIVFKGLKGQWIGWLCGGLLALLLLFAICYIAGLPLMVCVVLVGVLGTALFMSAASMNKRHGEHGWMKLVARKATPKRIKCDRLVT